MSPLPIELSKFKNPKVWVHAQNLSGRDIAWFYRWGVTSNLIMNQFQFILLWAICCWFGLDSSLSISEEVLHWWMRCGSPIDRFSLVISVVQEANFNEHLWKSNVLWSGQENMPTNGFMKAVQLDGLRLRPVDQKGSEWHQSGTWSYRFPESEGWRCLGNPPARETMHW